jgi:hypothetical protein
MHPVRVWHCYYRRPPPQVLITRLADIWQYRRRGLQRVLQISVQGDTRYTYQEINASEEVWGCIYSAFVVGCSKVPCGRTEDVLKTLLISLLSGMRQELKQVDLLG